MSAVACKLYRIRFKRKHLSDVLVALNITEMFEPVAPLFPVESDEFQSVQTKLVGLQQDYLGAIDIVNSVDNKKQHTSSKVTITTAVLKKVLDRKDELNALTVSILEKKEEFDRCEKEIETIKATLDVVEPVKNIEIPLFEDHSLIRLRSVFINNSLLIKLESKLKELDQLSYDVVPVGQDSALLIMVYPPDMDLPITQFIKTYELPEMLRPTNTQAVSPKEVFADLDKQLYTLKLAQAKIKNEILSLGRDHLESLYVVYDLLSLKVDALRALSFVGLDVGVHNNRKLNSQQKSQLLKLSQNDQSVVSSLKHGDVLQIDGWLDPEMSEIFQKKIKRVSPSIRIDELDSADDPEVRTIMKNSVLLRPFELITSLLGTPHPTETDPSPFVAPFFILFFGFALGDAGYGLLLIGLTLRLMSMYKHDPKLMNVLLLVLYCSISTFVFGALTGGWFGADLMAIGPLGAFLAQFKYLDLQANLIMVLSASLFIGFIHQLFGLILSAANYIRSKDILGALFDPGSWFLLLVALIAAFASAMGMMPEPLLGYINPLLWFSLVFFAFGQGRGNKNVLIRPLVGLAQLFNLTGYVSNTLSYARLLALALATGVIGSVVNLLTMMTAEISYIGPILAIFVFVGGHLFNILLNVMGTFINVARLHLVEFFPRFFAAKGIAHEPLHPQLNYTSLHQDSSVSNINEITKHKGVL
jgi:vacuolar-type H+-ATPase subunit I/STV1